MDFVEARPYGRHRIARHVERVSLFFYSTQSGMQIPGGGSRGCGATYHMQFDVNGGMVRQGVYEWIGTFNTAEEAAIAYDTVARRRKGSSAITNFKPSERPVIVRGGTRYYVTGYNMDSKTSALPQTCIAASLLMPLATALADNSEQPGQSLFFLGWV